MNWLGPVGIVGAGAVIATALASGGDVALETAVIPVPTPKAVETMQKPALVATTSNNVPLAVQAVKEKSVVVPKAVPSDTVKAKPTTSSCHPGYSGCLKMNAGDYDCVSGSGNGPNYTGQVEVYGSDPFDLDRDNDGWGCDS
jgi:hypothetical protein